ncbi:hypothetical protein VNO80_06093 [Phaseolus coccineus]|uniref:PGG domain-containing protein n=1 Tax=Phaseolus coccineus TaxID=3886 RepID=A0AAN9NGW8_PHACN
MKIFEKHPRDLSTARDEEELTALHMLARKPSEVLSMTSVVKETITGMDLLKAIWTEVRKLKMEEIFELTTRPSIVLFDAIESENNDEVILTFMKSDGKLTTLKDRNGRNLLHLLFLYRRLKISDKIKPSEKRQMIREVDNEGNNVLHLASQLPPEFRSFSGLRASKQMLSEVKWFKKVKENVPHELTRKRNKKGKRPVDVFYDEHKQLSEQIKRAAKVTAKSGMLVATLVATVAFAAVLTVPGDKSNDWFIVFILANTVALFTSSASILSFLSNFISSRFSESDFVTLHPGLIVGPPLLIISVVSMVMAFTAASFLILDCKTKWVSYVVASMWVVPLFFYLLFQFSILDSIFLRRHGLSKLVGAGCLQRVV